ncbi:MAG: DNA polymerase III [Treponemataceae bacterium]|nr:DNA polymerase III [Treponemataceae bacterium]
MFDNVLNQNVTNLLIDEIQKDALPQALLFSGPAGSGKLTCAIELARVISCSGNGLGVKGGWTCGCISCLKHKALNHSSLMIVGSRECTLEIAAAQRTFIHAVQAASPYIQAARYLFVRAVRKLTLRFNPILWEGDEKLSKMAPIVQNIDELLEEIDPLRTLLPFEEVQQIAGCIVSACQKLENLFLYDSIPVNQIRRAAAWTHLTTSDDSKKVLIIENADRMQDSVRTALLKILEEPPQNVIFILTTSRRAAVMPTILSRVRTYAFVDRTPEQQREVISRVFHEETTYDSVSAYLESFLPVNREKLSMLACSFLLTVQNLPPLVRRIIMQRFNPKDQIPVEMIINEAHNFEPRILFNLFLKEILDILRIAILEKGISSQEQKSAFAWISVVRSTSENVSMYNQSTASALESLAAELAKASS